MAKEAADIENRPEELFTLPLYGCLPSSPFQIDLKGALGDFLAHDLFDLDGNQPIEGNIIKLTNGLFNVNPSKEAIKCYRERGDDFQMINVVVCCYAFEEIDGQLFGLPYHVSLRPGQTRGKPTTVGIDAIEKLDLERVLEGNPHYMGFNPFTNAFGLYCIGEGISVNDRICSDVIGFVYNTYFLASKYDKSYVLDPGLCTSLLGESKALLNDYRKFRFSRYFKFFDNIEPIKVWGCDSPIELFLLQAMHSLGLKPTIQTHILPDGSIFPTLQSMWEGGVRTKALSNTITEVDFYFVEPRVAVFVDSVAHHSSEEAIAKDKSIDEKLNAIGVRSIRVSGPDIMKSPIECAKHVLEFIKS
ncbi:TPA: hypothetical protein ACRTTK_001774 [Aeromonas hydrophila]